MILLYCSGNIPDVIAVTETRINYNSSANITFSTYSTNTKTMVVDVGIYILSSLNAIQRSDLSFNPDEAESCRVEIFIHAGTQT